ncbi:MAG: hypothetical protein ABSG88_24640 [Bradyrhizobium sp.]
MKTPDEGARYEGWTGAAGDRRQNLPIVTVVLILCGVAALHLALWGLAEPRSSAAHVEAPLASVSYNRFAKPASADVGVPEARIRADLTAIAKQANAVRTYASTQGLESVPAIAAELGLTVTLGIWIDQDEARNKREIETALAWCGITPMLSAWSWAMKQSSGMNTRRPKLPKSSGASNKKARCRWRPPTTGKHLLTIQS